MRNTTRLVIIFLKILLLLCGTGCSSTLSRSATPSVPAVVLHNDRYPYSSAENKDLLGTFVYHASDLRWKDGIKEAYRFVQRPDITAEERSLTYLVLWSWETQRKRPTAARDAYTAFQKAICPLPPAHEIQVYHAIVQRRLQKQTPTGTQMRIARALRRDLSASFLTPNEAEQRSYPPDWALESIDPGEGPRTGLRRLAPLMARRSTLAPLKRARTLYLAALLYTHIGDKDSAEALICEFNQLLKAYSGYSEDVKGEPFGSRLADWALNIREMEARQGLLVSTPLPQDARSPYVPAPLPVGLVPEDSYPIPQPIQDAAIRYVILCQKNNADSALVLYKGRLVKEWYSHRVTNSPNNVYSVTKTWIALLTGMLLADGAIGSINDPVAQYIPEVRTRLPRTTLRDLLTHTSGVVYDGVLETVSDLKGARATNNRSFAYSTDNVELLTIALERAAKVSLAEYAERRLFAPLGLKQTSLMRAESGRTYGGGGGHTTARELATIGQLIRQQGRWGRTHIVPRTWIRAMTKMQVHLEPGEGYGYLTWIKSDPSVVMMRGDLYNICTITSNGLVLVRMQAETSILPSSSDDSPNNQIIRLLKK